MKSLQTFRTCAASAGLVVSLALATGCGEKAGNDVSDLQKAFPKEKAVTAESREIQNLVDAAAAAAAKGEYDKAAANLTVLRSNPVLSPDQRAAVNDTMGNIQTDLARRAEAGDKAAIEALNGIRGMKGR